jgi:hypothetical protein
MMKVFRLLSPEESLARDLDSLTRRLRQIAQDPTIDYRTARARSLCELALISVSAYETRPRAKAALNRLMKALNEIS